MFQNQVFETYRFLLSIAKFFIQRLYRKPAAFETFVNFFSLREKVTKRGKNPCRIYRAGHFCYISKLLAPPRVEILHEAKFTRNHGAFSRFAEGLWSAKRCA